jgi:hypothetical protein
MSSDTPSPSTALAHLEAIGLTIPGVTIALPTALILVSELALYTGSQQFALWTHFLTLLVCSLGPLRFDDPNAEMQILALFPVFRLVNLGMPVFVEMTIYWFPLVYGPLVPETYLLASDRDDVSLAAGWKTAAKWLPLALPLSVAMGVVEYTIIRPEALVPELSLQYLLVIGVVMFGFVGFVEELLFRGVLQRTLEHSLDWTTGLILASVLFGLMHSGYGSAAERAFATTIGAVYGVVYDYTDSLARHRHARGAERRPLRHRPPATRPLPDLSEPLSRTRTPERSP